MEVPGGHLRGGRRRGKGKKGGGGGGSGGTDGTSARIPTREKALSDAVDDILNNADRYNQWWTGPLNTDSFTFTPAPWGAQHVPGANAIFTTSVTQGGADRFIISSPRDLILFFGTARKAFSGDIVLAIETGYSATVKAILQHYRAVVYEIPHNLCSKATRSIFCGRSAAPSPCTRWHRVLAPVSLTSISSPRQVCAPSASLDTTASAAASGTRSTATATIPYPHHPHILPLIPAPVPSPRPQ